MYIPLGLRDRIIESIENDWSDYIMVLELEIESESQLFTSTEMNVLVDNLQRVRKLHTSVQEMLEENQLEEAHELTQSTIFN